MRRKTGLNPQLLLLAVFRRPFDAVSFVLCSLLSIHKIF